MSWETREEIEAYEAARLAEDRLIVEPFIRALRRLIGAEPLRDAGLFIDPLEDVQNKINVEAIRAIAKVLRSAGGN